ncbi:hypothetical protein GT347_26470 [Xylophilus rhododendri]|uniref:Prephenate dehydratase n=1 Tax=Xylophilus rhododendri TaxID=2697032 RepID=A0A857JDE3_9BURK|nr:hypothetical protein [Xylophilus rhododendri]QHJ01222.1 hypothetical protein GT347_26470 [Xylophilus rhododendri]
MRDSAANHIQLSESSRPPPINRLATICDDPLGLTCSMDVASRWGAARELLPHSSFELAALSVKEGNADAFLVAGAYPHLNAFIMDADLLVRDTFVMKIPALILACRANERSNEFGTLFHHPAVTPLLSELAVGWKEAVHAPSNSQACRELISAPGPALCITNSFA